MAAELIKRWRAADGSEHNSKQAVAEYEARQSLRGLLCSSDPSDLGSPVTLAIENALEVIAALRVFAPVKRPRKPKAEAAAEPIAGGPDPQPDHAQGEAVTSLAFDHDFNAPTAVAEVSDEFAGGYGNQAAAKAKGKKKDA
jgi:hypothetical protein